MSKWYEVTVTKTIVYAVEVEDNEGEEQAMEYALIDVSMGGTDEAVASQAIGNGIDSIKRHADEVLSLPSEN